MVYALMKLENIQFEKFDEKNCDFFIRPWLEKHAKVSTRNFLKPIQLKFYCYQKYLRKES